MVRSAAAGSAVFLAGVICVVAGETVPAEARGRAPAVVRTDGAGSDGDGRITETGARPFRKNLLDVTPNTALEGDETDLRLGSGGVAASGDFNGDGYADVAAIEVGAAGSAGCDGALVILYGRPGGIPSGPISTAADLVIECDSTTGPWPRTVHSIGDVNGDGFDDLVATDPFWDPTNPPSTSRLRGAIWVFYGSVSGIVAATGSDADAVIVSDVDNAEFGSSVSGAGDVNGDGYADLLVGASGWSDDPLQPDEGAVFLFLGSSAGLSATTIGDADTTLEGNRTAAFAGQEVAGRGDLNGDGFGDFVLGDYLFSDGEFDEGAILVFYGSSSGIPSNPVTALTDHANTLIEGNMVFLGLGGSSMTIASDVNGDGFADLGVGCPAWGASGITGEGALLVFHGGSAGLTANPTQPAADAADTIVGANNHPTPYTMQFGLHVVSAGDVNGDGLGDLIATSNFFTNPEPHEGGVFVFLGRSGGIPSSLVSPVEEVADFVIEGNTASLYLGQDRPDAGDVNGDGFSDLVLGASHYANGELNEGAVFIYHGGAESLADEADARYDGQIADDWLGTTSASAGDVNGDGYDDAVVGVQLHNGSSLSVGRVHLFLGGPVASLAAPDWTYDGQFWMGETGLSVASAGDVNGDGFGDLVVGTPNASNPEIEEGRVDVFYGSASGLGPTPDWSFEGNQDDCAVGWSAASAGDVNGDGYGDLIVGAPGYDSGHSWEGRASLFLGSIDGLEPSPAWSFESNMVDAQLGAAVASAGDVNGDGFSDVVVGAPWFESGETDEGAAYVFQGSETGLPGVPNWFIQTNRTNTGYGGSVAGAGDVNGDGYDDVIVGAFQDSNQQSMEGRAYIYHGSAVGLATTADRVLEMDRAAAYFGSPVRGAGDVNGDGFSDVVVGASNDTSGTGQEGRAYLFLGSDTGTAAQPAWFVEGGQGSDHLGSSVAGIGDHDGDGFADVVVGIPGSDSGAIDGGTVELYYGNAGGGRPVLARQMRGGGDPTPVQPWGLTHSSGDFRVSMTATSPRGRELAKLHVEACPSGIPFGDMSCRHAVSADWTAIPLGENGVVLTETMSGLTEDVVYHWRAHVLYLPFTADQPGITEPPVPRHGPWRRLSARADAVDIRVGEPQQTTIEFVADSNTTGEGEVQVEIEIVMFTSDGEASVLDSSVDVATHDGTAIAGQDYVHTSFSRSFPAGTASGTTDTIVVDLVPDTLDEPDETFLVELTNPLGAVLGVQTVHTATIADDDPPPELAAPDLLIGEGAGVAVVTLHLDAPTSFEVSVNYSTADGTAVAPEDYSTTSGVATIVPMDLITTVVVPIEDDWLDEGAEFFNLDLSGEVNAVLMTPTVEVVIEDDDAGIIFGDGFETGDVTRWSRSVP
jgi:hypothetical protein